ncbi:MAG: PAS domain S-box protein [Coriobacteriia bacterium]
MSSHAPHLPQDSSGNDPVGGLLRATLDSQPVAIAIYRPVDGGRDFEYVYVNDAYRAMDPARPISRYYSEVWPDRVEHVLPRFRHVMTSGEIVREHVLSHVVTDASGGKHVRYFDYQASRLVSGTEIYILTVATDMTREVTAREALRKSEERLKAAVSVPELVLAETDLELRYVWIHDSHPDADPEGMLGKRDDELDSSPEMRTLVEMKRRVLETGAPLREEWSVERSDGRHYYEFFLRPRFSESREITGVISVAIDITAGELAEEELRVALQRAQFLSSVIEQSSQPFVYASTDGRLILVNHAFEQLTGYSREELLNTPGMWSEVLTPEEWREPEEEILRRLRETGHPQRYEKEYVRRDGSRIDVELFIQLTEQDGAVRFYGFVTDVTELKRAREHEEELRLLQERELAIREAYSDVIDAVTGGHILILERNEIEAAMIEGVSQDFELREPSELSAARARVARLIGDMERRDEMLLVFSEAATNMLKHAGGGTYRVARDTECVQVILSDDGPGIDLRQLPSATLVTGFSTTQTLGMGFTLMLELADRLLLCSDAQGTLLLLEKNLLGNPDAIGPSERNETASVR